MGLLSLGPTQREFHRQTWPRLSFTRAATHVLGDAKITSWISSQETSPRFMRFKLESGIDPTKFLNSVAWTIRECPETRRATCPILGIKDNHKDPLDEIWIYNCLIQQILTQQPRSYLHMQCLVPILMDSIRSNVKGWKERTLWLCLRALIHAPLGISTYGFIYIETLASIKVLRKVVSAVRGTESMFRLVLAIAEGLPFDLDHLECNECIDLDLKSEDLQFIKAPNLFDDCQVNGPLEPQQGSASVKEKTLEDSTTLDILFHNLSLRLHSLGRWAFTALTWVAYAMRPLTLQELDLILAFEDAKSAGGALPVDFPRGTAARLVHLLPEFVEINSGRAFLVVPYTKTRHLLSKLSGAYLPSGSSPHLYIARSCLSFLIGHILNNTKAERDTGAQTDAELQPNEEGEDVVMQEAASDEQIVDETPQKEYQATEVTGNEENVPEGGEGLATENPPPTKAPDWDFSEVTDLNRSLAEYIARNWMAHYGLAEVNDLQNDHVFSAFIGDKTNIQNWLSVVEYFSHPHPRKTDHVISTFDDRLWGHLDMKSFETLKILYSLSTRPSFFSGLGRLLVYAAELADEVLVHSLCTEIGSIDREAVIRAIAVTSGSLHDDLMKVAPQILEQDPDILPRVQLTAQALGNHGTSEKLTTALLSSLTESQQTEWFSNGLKIAVEYGDDATVCQLLSNHDLVRRISDGDESRWTALHVAAHSGNWQVVSQLLEAGLKTAINIISPDGRSPLVIGSSYGFPAIARLLASNGAFMDLSSSSERTALHIASQLGFLQTVEVLLSENADVTAADAEGNFCLHLAIRRGHTRVAQVLVEKFPSIPDGNVMEPDAEAMQQVDAPENESNDNSLIHEDDVVETSYELEDVVNGELDNQETMAVIDDTASAPLNRANSEGVTVLMEAANRNLPIVVRCLLERGADPNMSDDLSRTALHCATRSGSTSLIQDLLGKGAVSNVLSRYRKLTPLHYCCYRGHVDAAKLLVEAGTDLSLEDLWDRTPLSAACASGYLDVMQALLPHYDREQRPTSLITAARYGHRDNAKHLLNSGCDVNGKNASSRPALLMAATFGQSRMIQLLLLRGADLEVADSEGDRAIHEAARNGSLETVKMLIDGGAEVNLENNSGISPLGFAIYNEYPAIVRLLLDRGAKMKIPSRWDYYKSLLGFTWGLSSTEVTKVILDFYAQGKQEDGLTPAKALIVAIKKRSESFLEMVNIAIETWLKSDTAKGASIGEALHFTASDGNKDFLRLLLERPIGITAMNDEVPKIGTVLHAAIRGRRYTLEMVQLLLEKGADAEIVSGEFGTTLNAACVAAKYDIAEILLSKLPKQLLSSVTGKYGTPIQSTIVGSAKATQSSEATIKMLDLLEENGVPSLAVGGFFFTPLHAAIAVSAPKEIVDWLKNKDSSCLRFMDLAGRLPLHLAIVRGNWDLVTELLGPSDHEPWWYALMLGQRNKQGLNGLHYAAMSSSPDLITNFLELGNKDIDELIDEPDFDGWTPLHWACRQPRTEIVKALVDKEVDVKAKTNEGWTPRQIAILHGNHQHLDLLPDTADKGDGLPDGAGREFPATCDACCCVSIQFHLPT